MKAFYSDLDNTLIYSYRKIPAESRKVVEYLNDREQSFMTDYTYVFLQEADWLPFIPVTSRTEKQFRRILFPDGKAPSYALICNGGKLLVNGQESLLWTEITLQTVRDQLSEVEKTAKLLAGISGGEVHAPEPYYYYTKTDEPQRICQLLRRSSDSRDVRVEYDAHKVYVFARSVNKGLSVSRFAERYGIKVLAAAGDGLMDIPLLNEAVYALAPMRLKSLIHATHSRLLSGTIISDQICRELITLHAGGIL